MRETPDPTDTSDHARRDGAESLALTLGALREEIRGLRASAQMRSVIEQAKGVLVERHGYSLKEAFASLRAMSQQHNVRLVEVAATIVGVTLPAGEVAPAELELVWARNPESAAVTPSWQEMAADSGAGMAVASLDSASSTDNLSLRAQLLVDLLEAEGVSAVTMYRPALDGSLRLIGQVGVPDDHISSWQSIPPSPDIPYVRALQDGQPSFWPERGRLMHGFPALSVEASGSGAAALIPLRDASGPLGVVSLLWSGREEFDEERQARILATVSRVAPVLLRHLAPTDPELEWLNTVLRLQLDPWLLLEAVRGADRSARDFVVREAATSIAGTDRWLGRRLLEIWPFLAEDGMAPALAGLIRSGGSWATTMAFASLAPWGQPGTQVRAVRLGDRLVLVWRSSASR